MNKAILSSALASFEAKYRRIPDITILSPGRVNLMGEHTDYNDGLVFPAAINYHIYVLIAKREGDRCRVDSLDFDEQVEFDLGDIHEIDQKWANLILGVAHQLSDQIGGFDLLFTGNIPVGAGLSSSAALCCGVALGLTELFGIKKTRWELAKIAQRSEHAFAHVHCGIMDQFACLFGKKDHAMMLDCQTLEYQATAFDLADHTLILFNANVPHALRDSAYNDRRKESAKALAIIQQGESEVTNYQDLNLATIDRYRETLGDTVWRRVRHIVSDNRRVVEMGETLAAGDFDRAGQMLTQAHQSLKDYYEVTCPETDFLVEAFTQHPEVKGARQVGGGFGGCILALAQVQGIDVLTGQLNESYQKHFDKKITLIPIQISEGCRVI